MFVFPLLREEELIVKKEVALLKGKILLKTAKGNVNKNNTFVSGWFTWSKKDGSKRRTRNLKRLSKLLDYKNFKVEPLQNVLELIRAGVYMASIDPKDPTMLTCLFEICICQMDVDHPCKYLQTFQKYLFLILD